MARNKGRARRRQPTQRPPPGSVPGAWSIDPAASPTTIRVIAYGVASLKETTVQTMTELQAASANHPCIWVDVVGLGNAEVLRQLQEFFGLHSLLMADVVNTYQRPKVESYGDRLFIVLRAPEPDHSGKFEQISLIVGPKFLLTFQEDPRDCFGGVRDRLRREGSLIRQQGPDYLAYALLDMSIDQHFPIVDRQADKLGQVEEAILRGESHEVLQQLLELKQSMISLRGNVSALRDVLRTLLHDPIELIQTNTRLYFRDCHDHAVQLIDELEHNREYSSSLLDIHLSLASQRMNQTMRMLTAISMLFLPLTFIAGVYGMNFDPDSSPWNMPELRWTWGYPFSLLLMLATGVGLFVLMRKRGWVGQ